ncbi:hypothetical protein [Agrococcus casei]|uniref:hypothetical protein n=1 Tax=Agrococcus casei TaxID=343512 RepID=UPI003F8DCC65
MTAAEAAALPPEDRPAWYRPPQPYAEGNAEHLGPGHRSPRVYSRVAAALVGGLVESRPDLAAHPEALASWADAEARAALLRYYLDEVGMIDEQTGETRETLLRNLDRFERRASDARQRLGLDPRSEAELALLRARAMREGQLTPQIDLGQLAAQGRAVLDSAADPVRAALDRVRAEAAEVAQTHDTNADDREATQ